MAYKRIKIIKILSGMYEDLRNGQPNAYVCKVKCSDGTVRPVYKGGRKVEIYTSEWETFRQPQDIGDARIPQHKVNRLLGVGFTDGAGGWIKLRVDLD